MAMHLVANPLDALDDTNGHIDQNGVCISEAVNEGNVSTSATTASGTSPSTASTSEGSQSTSDGSAHQDMITNFAGEQISGLFDIMVQGQRLQVNLAALQHNGYADFVDVLLQYQVLSTRPTIVLCDLEPRVVELMLAHCAGQAISPDDMRDYDVRLLHAANEYHLPDLSRECDDQLCVKVPVCRLPALSGGGGGGNYLVPFREYQYNLETVLDYLKIALVTDAPRTEEVCLWVVHDNYAQVKWFPQWQSMVQDNPSLYRILFEKCYRNTPEHKGTTARDALLRTALASLATVAILFLLCCFAYCIIRP